MNYESILRSLSLFEGLDDAELEAVSHCVVEIESDPDERILEEGTSGEALYIIVEGKVRVERKVAGEDMEIAELSDGHTFGEMSLIDDFPHSASVVALEKTSLLAIPRIDLKVLLAWDTALAAKLLTNISRSLCLRIRSTNDELVELFGENKALMEQSNAPKFLAD